MENCLNGKNIGNEMPSSFFVIDSNNKEKVISKLYGFGITDDSFYSNTVNFDFSKIDKLNGAFVYVERDENKILIKQDVFGSYGLYLFRNNDYYAISNSFYALFLHLVNRFPLSINYNYFNCFVGQYLCNQLYSETFINQIELLPSNVAVSINIKNNKISLLDNKFVKHSIDIDSEEGISLLDKWVNDWANIIQAFDKKYNLTFDLSGGFDSRVMLAFLLLSKVDLNHVRVFSNTSKLHVFEEDFRIATKISQRFNFSLNNIIYEEREQMSLNSSLELALFSNFFCHKEIYFKNYYYKKPKIHFLAVGGEFLRDVGDYGDVDNFIKDINTRMCFINKNSKDSIIKSTVSSINPIYSILRKKYGLSDSDKSIYQYFYEDIRYVNHCAKSIISSSLINEFCLSPFFDKNVLKINWFNKPLLFLPTLFFVRYYPALLEFEFEGNRFIADDVLKLAKRINNKYPPFKREVRSNLCLKFESDGEIAIAGSNLKDKSVSVDSVFKNTLLSYKFVSSVCSIVDPNLYNYALCRYYVSSFFPLRECYPLVAVNLLDTMIKSKQIIHDYEKYFSSFASSPLPISNLLNSINEIKDRISVRFDLKFIGKCPKFNIVETSDPFMSISQPTWLQKDGPGFIVESFSFKLSFKVSFYSDGIFTIYLRAKDNKSHNNKPNIICNIFKVDNNLLISKSTLINHDKYQKFSFKVKKGETKVLYITWTPNNMNND